MANRFWIRETHINVDEGYRYYDGQWEEISEDSLGGLFRRLQSDYGRCVSKQYQDRVSGPPIQTGWVFEKRVEYDDRPREKYTREVWVSVSITEPKQEMVWTVKPRSPWEEVG